MSPESSLNRVAELERGSEQIIFDFIVACASDLDLGLMNRSDLCEYAKKLDEKAVVLVVRSAEEEIIGMIGFYCNDGESRRGYVTFFAVSGAVRGTGTAESLMDACAQYCTSVGTISVVAESWRGKPWFRWLSRWARSRNHLVKLPQDGDSADSRWIEIVFWRGS